MLLHHTLERSAAQWPDRMALRDRETVVRYDELEAYANRISRCLVAEGVRPGDRVGVYLAKSAHAVAAIFGILKAGATYVPLDPDCPVKRCGLIAMDCDLSAIIVDRRRLKHLSKQPLLFPAQWRLLLLDDKTNTRIQIPSGWHLIDSNQLPVDSSPSVVEGISEDQPAYILYTSGSTGQPKGVVLSHTNGWSYVEWAIKELGLKSGEVFSSHAPFHFDLSIFDIYAAMATGGTLCLIPPGVAYFPEAILNYIADHQITVWYSVPSALVRLLDRVEDLKARLSSLKILIYAGEVFPYAYLNQLRKELTGCTIYNFYGPTETNVITWFRIEAEDDTPLIANLPIGYACSYADLRIVDDSLQPVDPGESGELIVRGESLMQGYWADEKKTRAAIRPVALEDGTHDYYFTGDIVRLDANGALTYINRRDNMVKTMGFRVELGEIESVLLNHPAIREAAVVAVPDRHIGNRLIGYISTENNGSRLPLDELDLFCARHLPAYMNPSKMCLLDQLPLTSTGKIDRTRLRETATSLTENGFSRPESLSNMKTPEEVVE